VTKYEAQDLLASIGIKPLEITHMNPAPTQQPNVRPAYEPLIDEFIELDKGCQLLVEDFTSGRILFKCMPTEGGDLPDFMAKMVASFNAFQEHLKKLIEKRNAKLQEASNAMRGVVMAADSVVRGPDGKSSFLKYGPFEVSSKTSRTFDPEVLRNETQARGLYSRLLELAVINKETGKSELAFRTEWKVSYEAVKNWLREQNLEDVLGSAYEEEEGTPAVTGPKPIGWIGEVDKKKGKKG
jgi:hypothetical protein